MFKACRKRWPLSIVRAFSTALDRCRVSQGSGAPDKWTRTACSSTCGNSKSRQPSPRLRHAINGPAKNKASCKAIRKQQRHQETRSLKQTDLGAFAMSPAKGVGRLRLPAAVLRDYQDKAHSCMLWRPTASPDLEDHLNRKIIVSPAHGLRSARTGAGRTSRHCIG